jgi:hypothetical protein
LIPRTVAGMNEIAAADTFLFFKITIIVTVILNVIGGILGIASFFRRQPSIDQALQDLAEAFRKELASYAKSSAVAELEDRVLARIKENQDQVIREMSATEKRTDSRFEGMHSSLVEERRVLRSLTETVATAIGEMRQALRSMQEESRGH